jgi:hypothetical protein
LLEQRSVGTGDNDTLVLGEGISSIANLFDFIVNPPRFRCMELEAGPGLYAVENGLIEKLRTTRVDGSRDVIHDLKRRAAYTNELDMSLVTSMGEKKDL